MIGVRFLFRYQPLSQNIPLTMILRADNVQGGFLPPLSNAFTTFLELGYGYVKLWRKDSHGHSFVNKLSEEDGFLLNSLV